MCRSDLFQNAVYVASLHGPPGSAMSGQVYIPNCDLDPIVLASEMFAARATEGHRYRTLHLVATADAAQPRRNQNPWNSSEKQDQSQNPEPHIRCRSVQAEATKDTEESLEMFRNSDFRAALSLRLRTGSRRFGRGRYHLSAIAQAHSRPQVRSAGNAVSLSSANTLMSRRPA